MKPPSTDIETGSSWPTRTMSVTCEALSGDLKLPVSVALSVSVNPKSSGKRLRARVMRPVPLSISKVSFVLPSKISKMGGPEHPSLSVVCSSSRTVVPAKAPSSSLLMYDGRTNTGGYRFCSTTVTVTGTVLFR